MSKLHTDCKKCSFLFKKEDLTDEDNYLWVCLNTDLRTIIDGYDWEIFQNNKQNRIPVPTWCELEKD